MKVLNSLPPQKALLLFRVALPLFLLIHGVFRLTTGGVVGFGEYLNSEHFIIGPAIAWTLTIVEIVGSVLIMLGYGVRMLCLFFIAELLMGIIMVHAVNGWFVVGGGSNGVEFSVLLILGYVVLALSNPKTLVPEKLL